MRLSRVLRSPICAMLLCTGTGLCAQQPTPSPASSNWAVVQALAPKTKVHITTDHGGHTCRIFAVTADALTCDSDKGRVIQRAEIQHIKLTHYGRATLVGTVLGGGIGAIAGGISGRTPATRVQTGKITNFPPGYLPLMAPNAPVMPTTKT